MKYLQPSPYSSDEGLMIGKIPAEISKSDLAALGHPESPAKAIRAKCLDCVGRNDEIRKCVMHDCALWPYRMGKNPFHKSAK